MGQITTVYMKNPEIWARGRATADRMGLSFSQYLERLISDAEPPIDEIIKQIKRDLQKD